MFERVKRWWRGVYGKVFSVSTLKQIIGENIALSQDMIEAIERWSAMYAGKANWCIDEIHSLRIEHGIVREFANVTINEMETSLSNDRLDKIYQSGIKDLNENLQVGLAKGAFIIKPLGGHSVQYIPQGNFIPVRFDSSGRLKKVVFLDTHMIKEDLYYIRFEFHSLSQNGLTIINKAYQSFDGNSVGKEIPLSAVAEWTELPEEITYPIDYPDFGYYRNPIANTIDGSHCGVSVFDSATQIIEKADKQFGRIDWEYDSGERAIYADVLALKDAGTDNPKRSKLLRSLNIGKDDFYQEFSPEMRDEAYIRGLEEYKRDIEFTVGLAYGDLSKVSDVEKTAEEVRISKQRKYNSVNAIQSNLRDCLEDFAKAIAFYNGMALADSAFSCTFRDSILTDEDKERQKDREDVAMGAMQLWEYRAKYYDEDEKTAKAAVGTPAEVIE